LSEQPRTAEAIIVGGGAVGTSIAYQLAESGLKDVLLLERDQVGAGSTSKAAGGVRVQFPLPVEVQMSLFSLKLFHDFEAALGRDADFRQAGYLYLLTDPATLDHYRGLQEMQRSEGADVRWLTAAQAAEIVPDVNLEDVHAATFCAEEGYAGPSEVVQAYAARARSLGVRVIEGAEVTGIAVEGERVAGVDTAAGRISTRVVVNAAGPWARPVGELVGLSIPVFPRRRHIFVTAPIPELHHPLPLTTDRAAGFYCRSELKSVLMSPGDIGPTTEFEVPAVDWSMMATAVEKAIHRIPALERSEITSGWVGLRPLTPDEHAIIDRAPGVEGMFLAVGFCGHGFQHSPAAGRAITELIVKGHCSSFDLAPLRYNRFAADAKLAHAAVGEAD
jgi:sarcosine oxidase subunit beta